MDVDDGQRQLCWAHVLRNVIAIAKSRFPKKIIAERRTQIIQLLCYEQHRYEQGELERTDHQKRINRIRQ